MAKFFSIPFAETGDKISPPNPTQTDGTVSYAQGFGFDYQRKTDGTDPLAKVFPREQFNGIVNDITGAVGEIQLNGLAIWQDLTPKISYPVGALVRYNNKNWVSLVANNTVTPVEGGAWAEISANGYTKVQVDAKLLLKADKASSLAGYGITDAYTKTQVEALTAQATEISLGTAKIATQAQVTTGTDDATIITPKKLRAAQATQAQVDAGVDDATIVTPKKMRWGFAASLGSTGYLKLPSWLGGLVFQWGNTTGTINSGQSTSATLPFAFPNGTLLFASATVIRNANDNQGGTCAIGFDASTGGILVIRNTTAGAASLGFKYLAIGV